MRTPIFARRPAPSLSALIIGAVIICPGVAVADAGIDAGALQQIFQQQEQQRPLPTPQRPSPPAAASAPAAAADTATFEVLAVRVTGVPDGDLPALQQTLAPHLGRRYALAELNPLRDVIRSFYRRRGLLVIVYVPPQSIGADGALELAVKFARLGRIHLDDEQPPVRLSRERARRYLTTQLMPGQTANRFALERGVELLKRLPGVFARGGLEAGQAAGQTDLRVALSGTPLVEGSLEVNNGGSRATGTGQLVLNAALNGPLSFGDQGVGYAVLSQGSQFGLLSYSVPVGYHGTRLSVAGSLLEYRNVGIFEANGNRGSAWTTSASLSHPLLLAPTATVTASTTLAFKSFTDHNLATGVAVNDYRIVSLSAGLNGSAQDDWWGGAASSWSVTLSGGRLSIRDAELAAGNDWYDEHGNPMPILRPQFLKLNAGASRLQRIPATEMLLHGYVQLQLANGNLSPAEKIYLGGQTGVRGYPIGQGGGAQGLVGGLELRRPLRPQLIGSVFADAGLIQQYRDPYLGWQGRTDAGNVYMLYSAGFGAVWKSQAWTLTSQLAFRIGANPLHTQVGNAVDLDNRDGRVRVWLALNYRF